MTEPPPAYKPQTQDQDGPETTPAKPKKPDAPAPDGEGVLKSPLKRMMYIGVTLLLYFILSFWMPVYWMTAAANYCPFACKNYPGASTAGSYTVDYSSSSYSASGFSWLSTCYETTDPACETICLDVCGICEDDPICSDTIPDLYEATYLNSGHSARLASFTLTVIGMALGFLGCILGYFAVKKGNTLYSQITTGLLGIGGLMIAIGAIIFMATWHENIDFEEVLAAQQLLVLIEWLLPSIICIVLALDVYGALLNDERKRMFALTVPFAVLGLMAGILMAYIINYEPVGSLSSYEHPLYGQGGCIAAGYFIVALMAIARILIWGEYVKVSDNPASVITAKFAVSVIMVIGAIILAAGYWALIDAIFECDISLLTNSVICEGIGQLLYINGDMTGITTAFVADVPYQGQFKCYYVAYTFFILLITAINAYDMDIKSNYAAVRAAQQTASAAS